LVASKQATNEKTIQPNKQGGLKDRQAQNHKGRNKLEQGRGLD